MNLDLLFDDPNPGATMCHGRSRPVADGFRGTGCTVAGRGLAPGRRDRTAGTAGGIGALQVVLPALAKISQQRRWIAWVAPPYTPYAPALAAAGVDLSRVLLVYPRAGGNGLAAVERSLRSGTCGAVLAWPMAAMGRPCANFSWRPRRDSRGVFYSVRNRWRNNPRQSICVCRSRAVQMGWIST